MRGSDKGESWRRRAEPQRKEMAVVVAQRALLVKTRFSVGMRDCSR
jgi:hypothetical protein